MVTPNIHKLMVALTDYQTLFNEPLTKEGLNDYIEGISKEEYRERFLKVSLFFGIIYNKTTTILPEYLKSAIQLIMMMSIIETLQSYGKYKSTQAITDFFNKYFSEKYKRELVQKYGIWQPYLN